MERQSFYERFKTLSWQQQIGNISSTLANLSSYAISPAYDELTKLSLREAALAIDWCAPNVPQDCLLDLSIMHREILAWWQAFPVEPRSLLALYTRHQSDRLLVMAGLMVSTNINSTENSNQQSINDVIAANKLPSIDLEVVK